MNKCIKHLGILIILMAFSATAMADTPSIIGWGNDITNRIWQEPGGKVRYGNVQSNDTNF